MRKSVFLLFIFITANSFGQTSFQEYKRSYEHAIQLYANSRYENAIQALLPLTSARFNNQLVPYSHYYLALCANNIGNFYQSKNTLRQLIERYPDWKKIDEANYLYAEALFNEKEYEKALFYINQIQDKSILLDLENMEYKYISQINEIFKLKSLNTKFPTNKTVAEFLVKQIQEKKYPSKEELELSDRLSNTFNFIIKENKSFNRDYDDITIDFGVLLPFKLNENAINLENSYAYEILIGLEIAKEKLKNEGINTRILAFDVENEESKIINLVNQNSFKTIDVFIGPLYPKPNEIATDFALKYKILQIHPLSNNSLLTKDKAGVFLAQSSYKDQSDKALRFATTLSSKRTVAIYFGNSKKDSLYASVYAEQAIKNGFTVIDKKRFNSYQDITTLNANHIFLAATPDEINGMIRDVKRAKNNTPIITPAASFDFSKSPISLIENDVYLIYPEYINNETLEVQNFKDQYILKMGILPTYYAYLGYDLGLYFSRILKNGKDDMRNQMNLIEHTSGYTLSGFDYTNNKNSNQLIPIVKVEHGKFIEITR